MSESHPYISGAGNIAQMVTHLRKSFPQSVTSDTVKKLGLASNNESYVINALNFIGIIDEDGKKTSEGSSAFSHHTDDKFSSAFSKLVEKAYSSLFELFGENSWNLHNDDLITFFRQSDQTSDAIGKRQAATFKIFAAVSGHGEIPIKRGFKAKDSEEMSGASTAKKSSSKKQTKGEIKVSSDTGVTKGIGLTVRVEINLPADGSKETYDSIFKSIKENLIDG